MARYKKVIKEEPIPEEAFKPTDFTKRTLEVRGRDDHWKVYYPDEASIASPVPYYDREGKLKEVFYVGVPTSKMIAAHETFTTQEAAIEHAEFLSPGCQVKIITSDRAEVAARAREAKRLKADNESDDD